MCIKLLLVSSVLLHICIMWLTGPTYHGCRGYLCDNGTRCLGYWDMCDSYEDCNDGYDEAHCCKRVKIVCKLRDLYKGVNL